MFRKLSALLLGLLFTACSFLSPEAVLEKNAVQNLVVQESQEQGETWLKLTGTSMNSALVVDRIELNVDAGSATVLVYQHLVRGGVGNGDISYRFKVSNQVQRVYFGNHHEVIWVRTSNTP